MMSKLGLCPDCKTTVSVSATACPKCGRPLKEGDVTAPEEKPMPQGCFILIVILLLLAILLGINASKEMENDKHIRERILDTERKRSGG